MILVTGASGKTGQAIIKSLHQNNVEVRAFTHRQEYHTLLKSVGADEILIGNLENIKDISNGIN